MLKKILGCFLIVCGIGSLGYWVDRSFFHPTHADRQRMATVADTGSDPGDNRKLFLVAGVALVATGSYLATKS